MPLERLKLIQQDEALKARYLKELPAEEAFKPSFKSLVDPDSDAFKTLTEKIPRVNVGTDALDAFEKNLALGTRAMNLARLDTTDKARSELAQLGDGTGPAGALASQVRKTIANALRENQTTTDFIVDEAVNFIPQLFGYDVSVESGRLAGSSGAEEVVSGIRELGVLQQNLRDPAKRRNLGIAMESLTSTIESSIGQLNPEDATRALQMIRSPGEAGRFTSESTQLLLQRIAESLDDIAATNGAMANPPSSNGSQPSMTPTLSNVQP